MNVIQSLIEEYCKEIQKDLKIPLKERQYTFEGDHFAGLEFNNKVVFTIPTLMRALIKRMSINQFMNQIFGVVVHELVIGHYSEVVDNPSQDALLFIQNHYPPESYINEFLPVHFQLAIEGSASCQFVLRYLGYGDLFDSLIKIGRNVRSRSLTKPEWSFIFPQESSYGSGCLLK